MIRGRDITEKEVEHQCDQLMKALGWTPLRFSQSRASHQTHGIPDRRWYPPDIFHSTLPPTARRPFWMEVKRPGGHQSAHQLAFQRMCEASGEDYVLGGIPELVKYLDERGIQKMSLTTGENRVHLPPGSYSPAELGKRRGP